MSIPNCPGTDDSLSHSFYHDGYNVNVTKIVKGDIDKMNSRPGLLLAHGALFDVVRVVTEIVYNGGMFQQGKMGLFFECVDGFWKVWIANEKNVPEVLRVLVKLKNMDDLTEGHSLIDDVNPTDIRVPTTELRNSQLNSINLLSPPDSQLTHSLRTEDVIGNDSPTLNVRQNRRTRTQTRRFSPPLPQSQKELSKKKRNVREKSLNVQDVLSPPATQISNSVESVVPGISIGDLRCSSDLTNMKDDRVGSMELRHSRKTRNQPRRYSPPPPTSQNGLNKRKRNTRSLDPNSSRSPSLTPKLSGRRSCSRMSGSSERSPSLSRTHHPSDLDPGISQEQGISDSSDYSVRSGRIIRKRHINTKDFKYDNESDHELFIVPSLPVNTNSNRVIASSVSSNHSEGASDADISMNDQSDNDGIRVFGESDIEVCNVNDRDWTPKNRTKRKNRVNSSNGNESGLSDVEIKRMKSRERAKKHYALKKKGKEELRCNTPSTSKDCRVRPNTPSTMLSNRLMDSLNFENESSEGQSNKKEVFHFPVNYHSPVRPRPSIGRDINMPLEEWLSLRNRNRPVVNQSNTSNQSSDVPVNVVESRVVNDDFCEVISDSSNVTEVIRQAVLPEDIPSMSAWRAAREQRKLDRRLSMPTLNRRKTRIMASYMKDFTNPIFAVPQQCDLKDRKLCPYCHALTYTYNCCNNGRVRIPPPRPPPKYIRKLLTGTGRESKHFRSQIVKYNAAFAMGSNSYDRTKTRSSEPFIKINGMIHHYVSGSMPLDKKVPLFHQLYKYDITDANKYRMMNPIIGNSVMPNILRNLQMILEDANYNVKQYKTAIELIGERIKSNMPMKNLSVVLRAPSEVLYQGSYDPKTLARPRQELQSILYTTEADGGPGKNELFIVHRLNGGRLDSIGFWNPLVDPLGYPMLFPYGNPGFKRGEYRLDEDYNHGERIEDDEYPDCYPFEELHDEMMIGVEPIDYNSARLKYKAYRIENGEDVSSSEDDDSDQDDQEEVHDEDFEVEEIGSENDNDEDPHFFFAPTSDEEEVPLDEEYPIRVNITGSGITNAGLSMEKSTDDSIEKENDVIRNDVDCSWVDIIDEEIVPNESTREKSRREFFEKENKLRQKVLERERRLLIKNDKITKFKDVCFQERFEPGFLSRYFKDEVECRKVSIELDFLEYKRIRQRDNQYWLSYLFFGLNRNATNEFFNNDFNRLQEFIDCEIALISGDPQYKCNDPNIKRFRDLYLAPSQLDDNVCSDYENPDNLIQQDVTQPNPIDTNMKRGTKRPIKPVQCSKGRRVFVSRRQHALHQMQIRDPEFHPYLSTILLGQLYVIDLALRIIRQRNDNIRDHMIKLRGTHENTLTFQKHNRSAAKKGCQLGYAFELTNSQPCSTSWYREMFENSMAIMDYCGKPDLFITLTGNPGWKEIEENRLPNTEWHSNPFLVNDVFHMKMQDLLNDVIENELFGPVVAYCYSIEFQKRGMPHMHLLITLQEGHKLDTSDKIDKHIKATIPEFPQEGDEHYDLKKRYRENVEQHMIHSACGGDFKGSYCHVRTGLSANRSFKRCTKNFPYPLNTHTSTVDGGKVLYHRPDDRVTCTKVVNNQKVELGNEYVVPYSPFLLNKYGCHVNVEAVTTVDVVKYIYKYIYKGFDRALAQFIEASEVDDGASGQPPRTVLHKKKNGNGAVLAPYGVKGTARQWSDMIERTGFEMKKRNIESTDGKPLIAYDEAIMTEVFRQLTASEAAWIIQGYYMAGLSHNVVNLSVHEEGKMPIFFREGEQDLMKQRVNDGTYMSMFAAWFKLNSKDKNARKFTYDEIPLHYKFEKDTTKCEWRPYEYNMTKRNIVRVRPVSPRYLECFAIRLLAMNTKGPRSYEELRTVDGRIYETAHDAAKAKGLMDSQVEFDCCLDEAKEVQMPYRLRRLFATILIFGGVTDPPDLWKKYEEYFYERSLSRNKERARNATLFHLQTLLSEHGLLLSNFNLPGFDESFVMTTDEFDEVVNGGRVIDVRDDHAEAEKMIQSLNSDQSKVYKTIMKAVECNGMGEDGNCFFLQGSGGCGKTYVYRALYHKLQTMNVPVMMVATTGIAATLLIKGTTAHRKFMLPLNADSNSTSSMKLESEPAEELRQTTVIILDESTMASRFLFKAIDKLFRDLMEKDVPFGGKIILLGGDWKQLLPVVPGFSSNEAMFHTLKEDPLWSNFKVLTLSKNMRAQKDPAYSTFLENVGNGLVNGIEDNCVVLNPKCIVQSVDEVIDFIYGNMESEPDKVASSCILASLNTETTKINEKVLEMLPGSQRTYMAIDTPRKGIGMQVPPEYFRDEMPSGLPPYELNLKVGAVVILLRNLCVSKGLCNGSRLRVLKMYNHYIECELLTTDFAGSIVWISKLSVEPPSKGKKNANFSRFQLPIRLAYAMTINKAQGQTFDRVGIILQNNVFAHGQLYVALSRARESDNVRVYSASRMVIDGRKVVAIRNHVERGILEYIPPGSLIDPNYVCPGYVDVIDVIETYKKLPGRQFIHDHSQSSEVEKLEKKTRVMLERKKNKLSKNYNTL